MLWLSFLIILHTRSSTLHYFHTPDIVKDGGVSGGIIYEKQLYLALNVLWPGNVIVINVRPSLPLWPLEEKRPQELDDYILSIPSTDIAIMSSIVFLEINDLLDKIKFPWMSITHFPISTWPDIPIDLKNSMVNGEMRAFKHGALHVIAGDFSRPYLINYGVPRNEIINAPPGIDKSIFTPSIKEYREEGIKNGIKFLSIGNGFEHKSQNIYLEALSGLLDYNWSLTIVGRFTYNEGHTKKVMDLINLFPDRVTMLDIVTQEKLIEIYLEHDIFIGSSSLENWGMVMAEARYLGLPLIATQTGGVPFFCKVGCLTSKVNNVEGFRKNLKLVMDSESLLKTISNEAKLHPPILPSWEETTKPIIDGVKSLLNKDKVEL